MQKTQSSKRHLLEIFFTTYLADRLLRVCEVKIKSHRILAALSFESRENSTQAEIWERIVYIGYCDVKHNT